MSSESQEVALPRPSSRVGDAQTRLHRRCEDPPQELFRRQVGLLKVSMHDPLSKSDLLTCRTMPEWPWLWPWKLEGTMLEDEA